MATNSKVLITGAGGFLGSHLAESFLSEGRQVVGIDNFCSSNKRNTERLQKLYAKNFQFIEADVSRDWDWADSCAGSFQYVFHFASPASPPIYQELALETIWVNVLGLKHAIDFADQKAARCIFASTSEVYGDPQVHPQPESYRGYVNTVGPRSCYDEAKRLGETLLYSHNWKKNTSHGIVRIFNTYGPRMNPQDGRVVINFLLQGIQGKDLTVYGDGQQTRSFCYVDDLILGIRKYADSKLQNPVNIGNQKEFTILELAQIVQREIFSEKKLNITFHKLPTDDPMQRCPDISLATKDLGWAPTIALREGLKVMTRWLKEELDQSK